MRELEGLEHFLRSIQVIPWSKLEKRAKEPLGGNSYWCWNAPFSSNIHKAEGSDQYKEHLPKPNLVLLQWLWTQRGIWMQWSLSFLHLSTVSWDKWDNVTKASGHFRERMCSYHLKQLKSVGTISFWMAIPLSDVQAVQAGTIALPWPPESVVTQDLGHILSAIRGKIGLESLCTVRKLGFHVRNVLAYSWDCL